MGSMTNIILFLQRFTLQRPQAQTSTKLKKAAT